MPPAHTSPEGVATFSGVRPGRYPIQAEFTGFDTGVLREVRVRAGDNKQLIVLAIQSLQDSITVGRDAQESAADRRGGAFGSALTREQVDALSDDGSLSGRSPFTPAKGPERTQNYGSNVSGSLIKNRASFNVSMNGSRSFNTPNLYSALPYGTRAEALALRVSRDKWCRRSTNICSAPICRWRATRASVSASIRRSPRRCAAASPTRTSEAPGCRAAAT